MSKLSENKTCAFKIQGFTILPFFFFQIMENLEKIVQIGPEEKTEIVQIICVHLLYCYISNILYIET